MTQTFECKYYYQKNTGNNAIESKKFNFYSRHRRACESFLNFIKIHLMVGIQKIFNQISWQKRKVKALANFIPGFPFLLFVKNWKKK